MYLWGNYNFQASAPATTNALKFPTRAPVLPSGADTSARNECLAHSYGFPQGNVVSHASGVNHHLFVIGETLYGFGSNHQNQLGSGVATYANAMRTIPFRGRAVPVEVACGRRHSLVRTADGMVFTAGDNTHGQLGRSLGKTVGGNGKQPAAPVNSSMLDFAEVALGGVVQVAAAENSSFALNDKGQLYSWGYQASGHLGHGDRGEGMQQTDRGEVMKNATVDRPTHVRWFSEKRVKLVQISAGKEHVVARSETDVYTMGEGFYGKLGTGDVSVMLFPHRVVFPSRKTPETLLSVAAGANHTLVLKRSGEMGSVVYHFGQSSGDHGTLTPVVVESGYSNITRIFAGTAASMAAVTDDGVLLVWGDFGGNSNGLPKYATRTSKQVPAPVKALADFHVTSFCSSGSTIVALTDDAKASPTRSVPIAVNSEDASSKVHFIVDDEEGAEGVQDASVAAAPAAATSSDLESALQSYHMKFDTIVPLADRAGAHTAVDNFVEAREAFYARWLGPVEGAAYVHAIPKPFEVAATHKVITKKGANGLRPGDKVRLWMTDVYALAVISEQPVTLDDPSASQSQRLSQLSSGELTQPLDDSTTPPPTSAAKGGRSLLVEWMRDDWMPEQLELFSDDETQDEDNPNRWQSVWFVEPLTVGAVGV